MCSKRGIEVSSGIETSEGLPTVRDNENTQTSDRITDVSAFPMSSGMITFHNERKNVSDSCDSPVFPSMIDSLNSSFR